MNTKLFKKLIIIIILVCSLITLTSCELVNNTNNTVKTKEVTLPDLTAKTRSEIKAILDPLHVLYEFKFDYSKQVTTVEMDMFTGYSKPYEIGSVVKTDQFFYVLTTILPIKTEVYKEVKLTTDYTNKSFVNDGIGKVTLDYCVDGDTAYFYDITGEYIKLRFLCIDTPESTKLKEPWGKAASNYTRAKLTSAKEIVLEREESNYKDNYDRFLGYVWIDGVLLNLLIVEECYSMPAASNSKYKEYFYKAGQNGQNTGQRIHGEPDPNYDYNKKDFK